MQNRARHCLWCQGIPTLILFKSGSRAETVTGYQSVASVERMSPGIWTRRLSRHLLEATKAIFNIQNPQRARLGRYRP